MTRKSYVVVCKVCVRVIMAPANLLLLDLDGVVLRHPRLQDYIRHRAVLYVQKVMRTSFHRAEEINVDMYMGRGHTWKGLHDLYGTRVAGTLSDFNRFVYNWDTMDVLRGSMKDDDMITCRHDALHLQRTCDRTRTPVWILSNAPRIWCHPVMGLLGLEWGQLLTMDHPLLDGKDVKPSPRVYELVNQYISNAVGPHTRVTFVDDSAINLEGAVPMHYQNGWNLVHFAAEKQTGFPTIRTLAELERFLV